MNIYRCQYYNIFLKATIIYLLFFGYSGLIISSQKNEKLEIYSDAIALTEIEKKYLTDSIVIPDGTTIKIVFFDIEGNGEYYSFTDGSEVEISKEKPTIKFMLQLYGKMNLVKFFEIESNDRSTLIQKSVERINSYLISETN
jgi:hypothetical protein